MAMCNVCGSANVKAFCEVETIRYKSQPLTVEMAYSVCQGCGREFVGTEQIRENDKAVLAAKRVADGLLAPSEVRHGREWLSLTQEKAAEIFGGGRNAFSKYERGEVSQSLSMDRLIRICLAHPELVGELKDHHTGDRVISKRAEMISVQDWQHDYIPVNDAFYHAGNAQVRSFTVVPERDVAYGS